MSPARGATRTRAILLGSEGRWARLGALGVALAVDALWGEPPPRVHPVVAMGKLLQALERRAPGGDRARRCFGAVAAVAAPLAWAAGASRLEARVPWWAQGLLLKPAFAGRALLEAGRAVEDAVEAGDLCSARTALRSLVSRPVEGLDAPLIRAAAIESLAENLPDSWLSPLLAYRVGGLAGAYAFRAINTADATWGYREPPYLALGWAAARLDDLAGWAPARLSALSIALVSGRGRAAVRVWAQDRNQTASPNAGQSMAAIAGALGLRLEKRGQYVLNAAAPGPRPGSVGRARSIARRSMLLSAALIAASLAPGRPSWRPDGR